MNIFALVVVTSNILGSFNDPFEFEGNYGEDLNTVRSYVFEQVVSKEALSINSSNDITQEQLNEAIQEDLVHGPTLNELAPPELLEMIANKQQLLQSDLFTETDLKNILEFIGRQGEQKVFSFFRHVPPGLLSFDKILRDQASRSGRDFDLPILSSTQPLAGSTSFELKTRLLDVLFTREILSSAKPQEVLQKDISALPKDFLKPYLGDGADNDDLFVFTTPAGQLVFYWLYQSLNLHLISADPSYIGAVNLVKQRFAETLGNPDIRAEMFRDKLQSFNVDLVFTQESDTVVPAFLVENCLYHPALNQNPQDGTLIFLRSATWESDYETVPVENYDGYQRGRLNLILATRKNTGERFLLASGHGNSTKAEDGRQQITKIVEKFQQLKLLPENEGLQLIIGIDANTKSEEDVALLRSHLDSLGLVATDAGPTTVKKRMVTAQHSKAGRYAIDEEDYLIVLSPDQGGNYHIGNTSVGFSEEKPDPAVTLPNMDNPSDHYPVGATLFPIYPKAG